MDTQTITIMMYWKRCCLCTMALCACNGIHVDIVGVPTRIKCSPSVGMGFM